MSKNIPTTFQEATILSAFTHFGHLLSEGFQSFIYFILGKLLKPNGYSIHFSTPCRQTVFLFLLFWSACVFSEYPSPVTLNFTSTEDIYISFGPHDGALTSDPLIITSSGIDDDDYGMDKPSHSYHFQIGDSDTMITSGDLTQALENIKIADSFQQSLTMKSLLKKPHFPAEHYDIVTVHVLYNTGGANAIDEVDIEFMEIVASALDYDSLTILHNYLMSAQLTPENFTHTFAAQISDSDNLPRLSIPALLYCWLQDRSMQSLENSIQEWSKVHNGALYIKINEFERSTKAATIKAVKMLPISAKINPALGAAVIQVLKEISTEWITLGGELNLTPSHLQEINSLHTQNEPEALGDVLKLYAERQGIFGPHAATVGSLHQALIKMNHNALAKKLIDTATPFLADPQKN